MEGRWLRVTFIKRNAFFCGMRHEVSQGTSFLTSSGGPIEAVLAPLVASQNASVDLRRLAIVSSLGVEMLRPYVGSANLDHGQLVPADSACHYFFFSCRRVESPPAGIADERNRERPGFIAHDERLRARTLINKPPSLVHRDGEYLEIAAHHLRI